MFRTAYRTHLDLSNLADMKANIMISINGIIISIIFASVSDTVAENPSLLFPAAVILLTCLGSLVFAILAARPRVSSEVVDSEQVRSGKRNILFFGNFVNMPEAEFVEGIQDLMGRRDDLYGTMSRDLYSLGGVLQKKYRLIRTAYNIFMVGISLGVTLFVIVLAIGVMAPPLRSRHEAPSRIVRCSHATHSALRGEFRAGPDRCIRGLLPDRLKLWSSGGPSPATNDGFGYRRPWSRLRGGRAVPDLDGKRISGAVDDCHPRACRGHGEPRERRPDPD